MVGTAYDISMLNGLDNNNSLSSYESELGSNSAELEILFRKIMDAKKNLTHAENNYRYYEVEYKKGKYTEIDLLRAEKEFIEKQKLYTVARYNYLSKVVEQQGLVKQLTFDFLEKIDKNLTKKVNLLVSPSSAIGGP